MLRLAALLPLIVVAVAMSGGATYAAARQCGSITDVSVSDLPSGGFVVIGDTKFLVGGVQPRNITVPFNDLRVGRLACAEGRFVAIGAPKTFDLYDGSVVLVASLPSTATGAAAGTPVRACGQMTEYQAATAAGPGSIVVAGERFAISSQARVTISSAARVGGRVCMEGAWTPSQTVGRNLVVLEVFSCPEHSSNFRPGPGCSGVLGLLPSTSTLP